MALASCMLCILRNHGNSKKNEHCPKTIEKHSVTSFITHEGCTGDFHSLISPFYFLPVLKVFVNVALDSKEALLSDGELSCSLATVSWLSLLRRATCLDLH